MHPPRLLQHKNAWTRMLLIFLACMLPFTLLRLVLYVAYHGDFRSLDFIQVLQSFAVGLRFDVSMVAMVIGIPLVVLMMLPFRWSHHTYWQRLWGWFIYLTLVLMIFMAVGDTLYFSMVHRHVGAEINTIGEDMASMTMLAISQYGAGLFLFGVLTLVGAYYWRYLTHHVPPAPTRNLLRIVSILFGLLLLVILGRGGVTGKPISVGEAFFSNSLPQGYLAMNGAFAVSRALNDIAPPPKVFMPEEEAIRRTHVFLEGSKVPTTNPQYPLYRQIGSTAKKNKPNIVVLMLESWSADFVDAMREQMHEPPLGVTPNFDTLAKQGRLYTNFYANGQRSIQGAAAILAGMPTLPNMPFLGEGLEQNRLSFLGSMAQSQGYDTLFLQSSDRGSLRFNVISERAGFATYLGNEDMPELHQHKKAASTWGTWDHNTLQEGNKRFAAAKSPFLGYIFTSTTHIPWLIPGDEWKKYPGNTDRDKALNAMYYADWALGEFFKSARAAGYFDNTIFVLVADHTNEFVENVDSLPNLFHIPLLIVGPGVKPGIDTRIGSQFDIAPTLADLAGWKENYAGLGRSLVSDKNNSARAALTVRDGVINWITDKGWVSHNLDHRMGQSAGLAPATADEMEKNLLAVYQATTQLQLANQLAP